MSDRARAEFGPNEWLVEELYRQYVEDPGSVGEAWRDFFADYRPSGDGEGEDETEGAMPPDASASPVAPPPSPPPDVAAATARAAPAEAPPAEAIRKERGEAPAAGGAGERPEAAIDRRPLRGAASIIAQRMEESLGVPTATSVRQVPAKLLEVNRSILNNHLMRIRGGGKVSFTHLIGWAVVRALAASPGMRAVYREVDGKPHVEMHERVTLGLAVDVQRPDGSRTLLVPNIKDADAFDFAGFFEAYEDMIRKVKANKLAPDDFAGTTATITNPGMIGTVQSVPRLMAGQSVIVGVGAIDYPAEFEGADPETLAEMGVGKVLTLTSTYDHRVIQGAESGEFLRRVHGLLLGEDGFYDDLFAAMGVPYVPVRWHRDVNPPRDSLDAAAKHGEVLQLVNMYRVRGHLIADLDPLDLKPVGMHPELDPATYGLSIWDLDRRFITEGLAGTREMKLRDILAVLRDAYCRTSTVEYMHIQDPDQKRWIQERVEGTDVTLPREEQLRILSKLGEVEALNEFLHRKYVGHKRFSLEGGDSLIPMLDAILAGAADAQMPEAVIGMAHRGRLDVLTAIVGKSFSDLFQEFEGYVPPDMPQGSGDVKYHIGAEGKFTAPSGSQILVSVASNPSHLESVDPVVEGMVRAKQEMLGDDAFGVLPILIHGDAAFAGQGVVAETLNLSQLTGFATGGTIHIIVNNQLGFTTGSDYGRSSTYSSDVAKMVQAPIWHVNGDDAEACVRVARLALEFRRRFDKDVVIDMWCYRRWGHNEGDDPSFTQPTMYRRIRDLRSLRKRYVERLLNRRDLSVDEAERALEEFRQRLNQAFEATPRGSSTVSEVDRAKPAPIEARSVATAVDRSTLDEVLETLTTVPDGFTPHPKLEKWLDGRRRGLRDDAVDWSLAEALAFGSLVLEGRTVRLSGQDSRRGTFSQRHSVLVDHRTGEEYTPLSALASEGSGTGRFAIYDSLLSEFAVLGFEYGYAVANPDALVLWEAQFGDFFNGAQVIVDQFIASGEDKWRQPSGIVLLLPHGFEGQGPEHSSARIERFLQLAAEDNMQVVVPSTPAQYFHVLRRQALRERKKPLVLFTPKSLLRLPAARSAAADLSEGAFAAVLPDPEPPAEARRVVLSQGKLYYDLLKAREDAAVALVRLEEVYPFPAGALREALARHEGAEVVWAQEEPENMGSWSFVDRLARRELGLDLRVVAREESGSPATGSLTIHTQEQQDLIRQALRD